MRLCSIAASEAIEDFKRGDTELGFYGRVDHLTERDAESALEDLEAEVQEVEAFRQDCKDAESTASDHIDELLNKITKLEEHIEQIRLEGGEFVEADEVYCEVCNGHSHDINDCMAVNI